MTSNKPIRTKWIGLQALAIALVLMSTSGRPAYGQAMGRTAPSNEPEKQPDLSADRDPVFSPDPEESAPAIGQPATGTAALKGKNDVFTLQQTVDEVLLNCTVVDHKGRLVTGLTQRDFKVWEDGVPQRIESFQHQDLPVSIGILVDNSGSMGDKRMAVNRAAMDLVRASNPEDTDLIVNFSDRAYLDQKLTSNINDLERGLARVDARSTTALYDAVVASANELASHATQPKQVVLIITDGLDNASRETLDEAIQRVQSLGGPVVYAIGLLYEDDKQEAGLARNVLETLTSETGGIAFFPDSLDEVDGMAMQVAQDVRNQYTIGYRSTRASSLGGYRTVRVEIVDPRDKFIVRTRKGYHAGEVNKPKATP